MNRKAIAAVVTAGVIATGTIGYAVAGPDRQECKTAMGPVVRQAIEKGDQYTEAMARRQLRWPCRFQSQPQLEAIGREAMAESWPELLAKAFEGMES